MDPQRTEQRIEEMGIRKLFEVLGREKRYYTMTADELAALDNAELRDAISLRMMKESGRMEVKQCLDLFTGAKRVFYIVSLYEAEVSTDSLCRFLVGPGRSAAPYVMDALKEIHASRHAELLRKFTADNHLDLADLGAFKIDNSWEYDERKAKYPFAAFDKKFDEMYEKESINNRLIQYVRNNIDRF